MPLTLMPAMAGPEGGSVVGGSATIHNPGTANVTVNQFSDRAIINWRLFDIGVGERVTFSQPNSSSVALNRVTGGLGPSQILGSLDANGRVFVVNKDGIIFGAGAVINTAGFLATTSDITNENFMAGRFNFNIPGRPDASIVNMGTITAHSGGFAALVAPGVRNSGTITANLGNVTLAAGNTFTANLDFYGDKLITLGDRRPDRQPGERCRDRADAEVARHQHGKLQANGGRVELTAAAARHVVDSVINTSGVIEANSVGLKNGQIVLSAATAATKRQGNGAAPGAVASLPPQKVRVSGKLSASGNEAGTKGGSIVVTGEHIEVAGATIDASGRDGGGKVLIGGDWGGGNPDKSLVSNQSATLESFALPNATTVSVDAATRIDASAKDRGDGGKVVLWADDKTSFAGTILALGGQEFGNGGFVETSGKAQLDYTGVVDTRAPNGAWGTLLLDPADFYIDVVGGPTRPPGASVMTNVAVQNQLALGNFVVATNNASLAPGQNGDIFVNAAISWNANTTLTLNAFRDVVFAFTGGPTVTNTGGGNLVVRADSTGANNTGSVIFNAGTNPERIDWSNSTGKVTFFYNPGSYTTPTNFSSGVLTNVPSQFIAYMLVHNATNLQNISTNLAGNYALSKNIDASSISNFAPLGGAGSPYTGRFEGQNFTISNLNIAPVGPSATSVSIGMFGTIGATGHVNNLNITNASVTANPNVTGPGQFVGILAGSNGGTISNVTVSGVVSSGTAQNGVIAGGLVGQNGIFGPGASMGAITMSHATGVSVAVGNASGGSSGNSAGGLVGGNPGSITLSTASGLVTGGANSSVGGLVGRNENTATIDFSTAAANVNVSNATGSTIGGLVGFNFGAITISGASGNVTGGASNNIFTAGAVGGLVGINDAAGTITSSAATGAVSAGANSTAGGLVGFNNGTILGGGATGAVSAIDNFAGGLVGFNATTGNILGSVAAGNVSGGGFSTGGFAGGNLGTITGGVATGNVNDTASHKENSVGGFVGSNSGSITGGIAFGSVFGKNNAGGFAGSNDSTGTIDVSSAFGNVTVTDNATGGGFVGGNFGTITNSSVGLSIFLTTNVTGAGNTVLGGFAAGNFGTISNSTASSAVSSTGPNSIVGGFAGVNAGDLIRTAASGNVSGTSESYLGGSVGINFALVQDSTASGTVTGSGSHNIAGGLVGVNFGFIDPSISTGNVSSGADSIVGGFVGANAAVRFPDGFQTIGTISSELRRHRYGDRRPGEHGRPAGRTKLSNGRLARSADRSLPGRGRRAVRRRAVQSERDSAAGSS